MTEVTMKRGDERVRVSPESVEDLKKAGYEVVKEPKSAETPNPNQEKSGSRAPEWKRKLWISENRNLEITVWPPGGKYDSRSVTLAENKRDDDGNWSSNRIYLPTGANILVLSENLKTAWNELKDLKEGDE